MNFGIEGTDDNLICLIRSCRQFGGFALPFGTDIVLGVDPWPMMDLWLMYLGVFQTPLKIIPYISWDIFKVKIDQVTQHKG